MSIKFKPGDINWLCLAWAALLLLGLTVGWNAPFVLAVVGTLLYLFSVTRA